MKGNNFIFYINNINDMALWEHTDNYPQRLNEAG